MLEDDKHLKIIIKLKVVIQKDVNDHFGHGRPTQKGVEVVRKYSQERLDQYIDEMMKESEELKAKWQFGHPLIIYCHVSLKTRSYAIEITTKDNPRAM